MVKNKMLHVNNIWEHHNIPLLLEQNYLNVSHSLSCCTDVNHERIKKKITRDQQRQRCGSTKECYAYNGPNYVPMKPFQIIMNDMKRQLLKSSMSCKLKCVGHAIRNKTDILFLKEQKQKQNISFERHSFKLFQ